MFQNIFTKHKQMLTRNLRQKKIFHCLTLTRWEVPSINKELWWMKIDTDEELPLIYFLLEISV